MSSNRRLFDFVISLQKEIESLCATGVASLSTQQRTMLSNTQNYLSEMGAQFLAKKISNFLHSTGSHQGNPAEALFDLHTTVQVYQRKLTLRKAEEVITEICSYDKLQLASQFENGED